MDSPRRYLKHLPSQRGIRVKTAWIRITARLDLAPTLHRAKVIDAIQTLHDPTKFTVHDLAIHMNQRSYKVKAAIGWLVHQGRVINTGELEQINRVTQRRYLVATYELLDELLPPNWTGLYAAFEPIVN
jgi:hypothetical protein